MGFEMKKQIWLNRSDEECRMDVMVREPKKALNEKLWREDPEWFVSAVYDLLISTSLEDVLTSHSTWAPSKTNQLHSFVEAVVAIVHSFQFQHYCMVPFALIHHWCCGMGDSDGGLQYVSRPGRLSEVVLFNSRVRLWTSVLETWNAKKLLVVCREKVKCRGVWDVSFAWKGNLQGES